MKSIPAISILPTAVVMEMTYSCNHACVFCSCPWFADPKKISKEMSIDEWKELTNIYAEAGVVDFCFTGGEPLLKEGIIDLIKHTAQIKAHYIGVKDGEFYDYYATPRLTLLSNGKLVDDNILAFCEEYKIALSISLPGVESFQEHTKGNQPVEHVLELFRKATNRNILTTAGITVTKKNFHELYDTISLALLAGAKRILLNRFLPGGRGLSNREFELTTEQVKAIPDIAESVLSLAKVHGYIGTEYPRCLVNPDKYQWLSVGTRCAAASTFFVVGPSGMLKVCNHSPIDLVYWRDYDKLSEHSYWKMFTQKSWTPCGCAGCHELGVNCDGGCREAAHVCNGTVEAKDPALI